MRNPPADAQRPSLTKPAATFTCACGLAVFTAVVFIIVVLVGLLWH